MDVTISLMVVNAQYLRTLWKRASPVVRRSFDHFSHRYTYGLIAGQEAVEAGCLAL
jgi:hypothetical protein